MRDRAERVRSIQLSAMALLSAMAVVLIYVIAVRTHLGQRIDDVAFARRSAVTAATTRRTDRLLGTVTHASLFVFGGAVVLVALARRRVFLAVAAGVAMSGAVLTTEVLKLHVLHRPVYTDIGGVSSNSYPSGHATIGMALALGVVMVAPVRLRRIAVVLAAFTSTAFGTAVLSSGWHRPSDTIGASFVALAWFSAASAVVAEHDRRARSDAEARPDPPASRILLALAATAVFGLLMFVLWRSVGTNGLRTVVYAAPYVAAVIGIDIVGLAVVGTYYVVERTAGSRYDDIAGGVKNAPPA